MKLLQALFGAAPSVIAPAPIHYVAPARAEVAPDAIDAALQEMHALTARGYSERYAMACAFVRAAHDYSTPNARTQGRKLRAWAQSLLDRETDRERERV